MAHEIYLDLFYNRADEPAWHRIGHNVGSDAPYDIKEAVQIIGGTPPIVLLPLYTADGIEVPYKAIMREPYGDDPYYVCGNVVSEDYGFISHEEAIEIAYVTMRDRHGNHLPVETVGFLRGGFELFATYELPTIEVAREEIKQYMLLHLPLTGNNSASISRSGVRTVCANTLAAALSGAREMYRIIHNESARQNLAYWMRDMYTCFEDRTEGVREAMDILTKRRATAEEIKTVFSAAYPLPSKPSEDAPRDVVERRMHDWELEKKRTVKYQLEAERLFLGDMTGYRSDLEGTFWYLYNAVAELENYRRGSRGQRELAQVAQSVTFGDRRDTMERTFAACLELATN